MLHRFLVFTLFHIKLKVSIHDYIVIGHFKKKTMTKTNTKNKKKKKMRGRRKNCFRDVFVAIYLYNT